MDISTLALVLFNGVLAAFGILFASMVFFDNILRWDGGGGGGANPPDQLFNAAKALLKAITARRNDIGERFQAIKIRHAALGQNAELISKPNEPMMEEMCAFEDENESILLEISWVEKEIQALDEDIASLQRILEELGGLAS
ncbi:hypothetical protein N7493_008091 [Penicillium malachiteum]|uniref:Uncharacterized protein n=1 Tax=Penicillium malachiteum TaxID=1324776 RepID=A0AAD6HGN7_9EURO|nr:hypothetical protein N7493_008091 [Penicillium malachiteum]